MDEKVTVSAAEQTDGLMLCAYCETEIPVISELIKTPIKEIVSENVDTLKQYGDNIHVLQDGQSEVEFSINGGTKIFSYSKSVEVGKSINCTTIGSGALPVKFNDFDVVDVQFDRSIVSSSAEIIVYLLDNNGNKHSELFVKSSTIQFIRDEQTKMCHYIGVYIVGSDIISSGVFSFTCTCSKDSVSDKIYDVLYHKEIVCFEDSLTAGNGSTNGRNYPTVLSELTNMNVVNVGVSGETSLQIATRQGALMLYCEPFTIPADRKEVNIVLNSLEHDYSEEFNIIAQSEGSINPVYINGVKGVIKHVGSWNTTPHQYTFKRDVVGTQLVIDRPTALVTNTSILNKDIQVIWCGTNDTPYNTENITEKVMERVDAMIRYMDNNNKYLIIGLTVKNRFQDIESINMLLQRHYGAHFVDIRKYLLDYGLADNNITPTEQDNQDIQSGEIPNSLRYDIVHLNNYGYSVVAHQVYERGKFLGYW